MGKLAKQMRNPPSPPLLRPHLGETCSTSGIMSARVRFHAERTPNGAELPSTVATVADVAALARQFECN